MKPLKRTGRTGLAIVVGLVVEAAVLLAGCGGGGEQAPPVGQINDWAYQLQGYGDHQLTEIAGSAFDLVVIDYSFDGTADEEFTRQEIEGAKHGSGGEKLVLAYISIGEAEDYRWYWQQQWATSPPSCLGPENPEWPGDFKVRYWDPGWQQLILGPGQAKSYLERIVDAGFDGVYLDIIDAYEFFGPNGTGERPTAEQDMVDFVLSIAQRGRELAGLSFLVFPQNAPELVSHADYLAAISGVGKEDTFYKDDQPQDPGETATAISFLDQVVAAGKPVLAIDYPTSPANIADFYARARQRGYVPYVSTRELDHLQINAGYEPD